MRFFMAIMILILLSLGCVYITGFFSVGGKNIFQQLFKKDFGKENKDLVHNSYPLQNFQTERARDKKVPVGIYINPDNKCKLVSIHENLFERRH